MEELGVSKTVKFYNVLLEVVISEKKWNMAEKYFDNMLDEGVVPDKDTYRVMISGLCRCFRVETARKLFEDMKSRNFSPDFVVYNAMINGYVGVKKMDEAEKIFMEMKGLGIEQDLVSYNLMINGYVQVRKMEDVERLVVEMKGRDIELDLVAYNTMVNGYVLVGKMEDAEKVVVEMKERKIEPDLVTYLTMIKGYVKADRVDDGLELLEEMKGKRFGRNVDRSCLGRLKEDCDAENMSESQQSVLQRVEDYVERLELLAMRDAARELSELASRRIIVIYLTIGSKSSELALSGWEGLIKSIQVDDALKSHKVNNKVQPSDAVESFKAVVAADDARCSEIGASVLRAGGHAADAAVSVALCGGVVNPMASGIGGGGFMVVRSADTLQTQAFDSRETAPSAASKNMYQNNLDDKYSGALSMGVPGEIAGLYKAWLQHGRMPWKTLFQPAISLAKDGFIVAPYLANSLSSYAAAIKKDPGLQKVYAPNGEVLQAGETCYNYELGLSLEVIAEEGPEAFYNGTIGEKLIKDVRSRGGILTMEDLRNYQVKVTDAVEVNTMGFTIFGMPPPSSGTLGLALVLNILNSYENTNDAKGPIGVHRFIEALKHMFALRMNLGDPNFVDISKTASEMLSPSFAKKIQQRIFDNTTFPSEYYMPRRSQIEDHGTNHFCIVDADRNSVSMTTTVNYPFGGGILSPSTGIVLNNEMGDFSAPTEISPDSLPPSPTNFISPNKRPLSSMTPVIIVKGDQLVGVIGGSGGMYIIPAVIQVFLNHFILGMEPLDAVQSPRVYHKLIPNVVYYENWTVIDGDHIELSDDRKKFLRERGHVLESKSGGAVSQLIVQTLKKPIENRRVSYNHKQVLKGMLTAISDPRKDGRPAAC